MDSTKEFWDQFVSEYWEKEPILMSVGHLTALPRVDPGELFQAIVACVHDFSLGGQQKVRLYVDDAQVDLLRGGHRSLLPTLTDGSFEGYNKRMTNEYGFDDYGLIIADWHQFSRSIWEMIASAVKGLSEVVGVSASRIDTQLFLGNYRATPFGVHVDPASAFHFPVIGKKVMRFWPDAYAVRHPGLHHARQYDRFLNGSTVLSAENGQMIYWPSHYWHVGEADGNFSVTWRFAYWMADGTRQTAIASLGRLLEEIHPTPILSLPEFSKNSENVEKFVDNLISKLSGVASSDEFRTLLIRILLEKCSAYGFLRIPNGYEYKPLTAGTAISKKPQFPILTCRVSEDAVCIAAAGYSQLFTANPDVMDLVRRLNEGETLYVGDRHDTPEIQELLEFCIQCDILTVFNSAKANR